MSTGRKVIIEFLGDDKTLSKTTDKASRATTSLGDKMKKVGKVAAAGLAVGAVAVAKGLVDMTQAAIEDEQAAEKLATTLRNSAGATDEQIAAVEDWITAQGKALGVTDDELRPALQRLTEATGDVGEAQRLASLAMDVSAGTGKSLTTISEALMKAQNGQVGALGRYGIETKNAAGETMSFEQITSKMAKTFKGQAEKQANTLGGKMGRLKLIMGELGEEIGAKLIPIVTDLADWFIAEGLPALERFGGYLNANLVPILKDIGAKVVQLGRFLLDHKNVVIALTATFVAIAVVVKTVSVAMKLWAAAQAAYTAVTKGVIVVTKAWAAGQWLLNAALTANPIGIIIVLIAAAVAAIVILWKKNEGFRKLVLRVWAAIKSAVSGVVNWFKEKVPAAWEAIRNATSKAFGKIKSAVGAALTFIKNLFIRWNLIAVVVRNWDAIKTKTGAAFGWIKDKITGIFTTVKNWVKDRISDIVGFIGGIKQRIASKVSTAFDGIKTAFKGVVNSVIDAWNALDFSIDISVPDWVPGVGGKGFSVSDIFPDVPRLARGGVVKARPGGTTLVAGEAGHDEAIVPLSGPHARRLIGGGDDRPIVVQLFLDGRMIEQSLVRRQRNKGGPLEFSTR